MKLKHITRFDISNCFINAASYLEVLPALLLGFLFFEQIYLYRHILLQLWPINNTISTENHVVIFSYLLFLTAVFFLLCSKFLLKIPKWLFFVLCSIVFLTGVITSLRYFDVKPASDGEMFFQEACKMATLSFGKLREYSSNGSAWTSRGFGCWFLPVKIFGSSPWVFKIINAIACFFVAFNIYKILNLTLKNEHISRCGMLIYLCAPFDYFALHVPNCDILGNAFITASIVVFIWLFQKEKVFCKTQYTRKKTITLLSLSVFFGFCMLMANLCRDIGPFLLLPFVVFLIIHAGFILLRYHINKKIFLHLLRLFAVIIVPVLVFNFCYKQIFRAKSLQKTPVLSQVGWLYSANARSFGTNSQSLFKAMQCSEKTKYDFYRQAINETIFYPLYDLNRRQGKFMNHLQFRCMRQADIYSEYHRVFCRPLSNSPADKMAFSKFGESFYNLRIVYIVLTAILALFGLNKLMRQLKSNSPLCVLLLYSGIVLAYNFTIGEGHPRHTMLLLPTIAVAGAVGLHSNTAKVRNLGNNRRFLWPIILACLIILVCILPLAGKKIYDSRNFTLDIQNVERKFVPDYEDKFDYQKNIFFGAHNENQIILPPQCQSGKLTWIKDNLEPGKKYRFSAMLRSTIYKDLSYRISASCNGKDIYQWNTTMPIIFRMYAVWDKPVGAAYLDRVNNIVTVDNFGKLSFEFVVNRDSAKIMHEISMKIFNVELIPE